MATGCSTPLRHYLATPTRECQVSPRNTRFSLRPLLGLALNVEEQRRPLHGRELASEATWIDWVRSGQNPPSPSLFISQLAKWLAGGRQLSKIMGLPQRAEGGENSTVTPARHHRQLSGGRATLRNGTCRPSSHPSLTLRRWSPRC